MPLVSFYTPWIHQKFELSEKPTQEDGLQPTRSNNDKQTNLPEDIELYNTYLD